jgi:hypothetical protein
VLDMAKQPVQTFCSSSRHTLMHGDGTAGLTLLYSGLGGRAWALLMSDLVEVQLLAGPLPDDALEHFAQQLFALSHTHFLLSSS